MADVTDPEQVDAATAFAVDAVARGHEGVMVKADGAAYDMGRRGVGWVKVKPVHTLDLVILAVERGHGRRSGWLSNIHLGARDPHGRFGPEGGFDGVQGSPRYPAGLALRFARVVRHRPDKTADEADPIELVEALYQW